jgi:peptidoglycan/LPS O-acetylase OafA/YrhL
MKYSKEIDGLRAVAVLSVLCFHMGITAFSGGFVGVDIFFVISGFLITKIISNEVTETRSFDFKNFYIRRIRRLFPALAFTLLLSFVLALLLFSPDFLTRFGLSLLASLFSVSNFYFWKNNDYFAPGAELEPLLHTWSLSVEEQFYLAWPFLLVFLLKRSRAFLPVFTLTAIFLLSLIANDYFHNQKELIFYLIPFRVFELAIGGLLTWAPQIQQEKPVFMQVIALAGMALIAYAVFAFNESIVFPSFNALIPCVSAAMVIYAGKNNLSSLVLGNRLLISTGLISYSLYLIHWPIIVFYKYYTDTEVLNGREILALTLTAFAMAWVMFRFIEQPFRYKKAFNRKNAAFITTVTAITAFISIGSVYAHKSHGMSWRLHNQTTFTNFSYAGDKYAWETYIGKPNADKKIIMYGDSHSKQYLAALEAFSKETGVGIYYLGHSACLALPGLTNIYKGQTHPSCIGMLNKLKKLAQGNDMPVMFAYRYTKKIVDLESGQLFDYKNDEFEFTSALISGFEHLHKELGDRRKFVIFGGVPGAHLRRGYIDCINRPFTTLICNDHYPVSQSEFSSFNDALQTLANRQERILFLDPKEALCDENYCYVVKSGKLYYSDHAHLTKDGASTVFDHFSAEISHFIESGT